MKMKHKILMRRSRRKDVHPDLKKLVKRLKEAEERSKLYRHEYVAFQREHSDIRKTYVKLRRRVWNARRKEHRLRMQLGVYSDEKTPIPPAESVGGVDSRGNWWGSSGPTHIS